MEKYIDLHTHSTASDGTDSPTLLVTKAKKAGLSALAITDHDTFIGLEAAEEKANELEIELIKGIEVSTQHIEGEVHILGYWIDKKIEYKKFDPIAERLKSFVDQRNEDLLKNLAKINISISLEEVYALLQDADEKEGISKDLEEYKKLPLHLPYFALLLVKKGYASDVRSAFIKYLGTTGAAFVPKNNLTQREVIEILRENNAFVSFAHPYLTFAKKEKDRKALVGTLKDYGLQGIEAYYSTNSKDQTMQTLMYAKDFNLLPTGGSDYHGNIKPHIALGSGMGGLKIPYSLLDDIREFQNL